MLKDNALGVRKTPEKTWIQVSRAVTIGLCGKHELPEEIHESGLFPTDRAKSGQMGYGGLLQLTTLT